MRVLKLFTIAFILVFSSCTQVEEFLETILIENPRDSTQVQEKDTATLEKPADNENILEDWELHGETERDKNISFDDREGSIKLSKTANTWDKSDRAISKTKLRVFPGRTYQISFKSYIKNWPPPTIHVFAEFYDVNEKRIFNSEGSYFSNSRNNIWEDNNVMVSIPNNDRVKYLSPRFIMLPKHGLNEDIWIDNISVVELENDNNIDAKRNFKGSKVEVDGIGNISISKNDIFEDFFPIGIYGDNRRSDWAIYSKQGFNCYMWASDWRQVNKAKEAGLMSSIQIGPYIIGGNWLPKQNTERVDHLTNYITDLKQKNLMDQVVFYYIDNEFYRIDQHILNVIKRVKTLDKDGNDKRMHPIYMLNGAYGQARKYNDLVDLTGTYVAQDRTNIPTPENFTGLQINENQNIPAVMAQINRGVGLNFRPVLFGAIAKGAKGMAFWRDGGSGVDITREPWWNDFPNIVKEINQMLPLIKEPHFTDWNAGCDRDELIFGTRMFKNKGHLIIANPTPERIQANFTINDLPYNISNLKNYFNNSSVGVVNGNVITITLDAHGSKVIRLD